MFSEKAIHVIDQGRIMAHCGPMRMVISARVGRLPQRSMCIRAAREAFIYLERISALQGQLRRRFSQISRPLGDPLAECMLRSVRQVGDPDLTPMAALAGTVADAVADFLFARGMTVVVVENGCDTAIRIGEPTTVMVGIRPHVDSDIIGHILELGGNRVSWGVATSGLGWPSLTRGMAASATVVADEASVADAAAKAIANAGFIREPPVEQRSTGESARLTDTAWFGIGGRVGPIKPQGVATAIAQSMQLGRQLISRHVILGALVTAQGRTAATEFLEKRLVPVWPYS